MHRPGRIVRQRQADALLVARFRQLSLEIGALERTVEALLDVPLPDSNVRRDPLG